MATLSDRPERWDFEHPSPEYASQPLWHMNGTLSPSEIDRQLRDAHESGFSGVAVLPVKDTRPDYLSDEYFDNYQHILERCRDLGMNVILYDDIGFPSGTAGGRIRQKHPAHIQYSLHMVCDDVIGPSTWSQPFPKGRSMAAVAMNTDTLERREMELDDGQRKARWEVPDGTWKIMLFTAIQDDTDAINYLSPEAVKAFIAETYNAYHERFPEYFGSTIKMSFFDDVHLRYPLCRIWTPDFNDRFEAETGNSPALLYPALWFDIGPDTASARIALFHFRAHLFTESFTRSIQNWTAAHDIKCSGHAMEQYAEQPTFMAGDNILFYKYSDIPMMDSIHYYGHGRPGFKMTSSATCTYGKALTSVEIYGNYREHLDTGMLYRSGMELFARGANVILPHGMWYEPKDMYIKPLISSYNPDISDDLPAYNEWIARCSLLLRSGMPVADIGVLYPIAALQAHASFAATVDQYDNPDNVHPNAYLPTECDLYMVSDWLTGGTRRDFTFLHPEIIDERCRVESDHIAMNSGDQHQQYQVIIIPGCRVIHRSNLQKIKTFYDAGGTVIATTALPSASAEPGHDADIESMIFDIFGYSPGQPITSHASHVHENKHGGRACFVPHFKQDQGSLSEALERLHPAPDLGFHDIPPTVNPTHGMLSYLHKVTNEQHIYFLANSTDDHIETPVSLRGSLCVEAWDPHTGAAQPVSCERNRISETQYTQLPLSLGPLRSLFLIAT